MWRDMGMDPVSGVIARLSVCLQPRKIFLDALTDCVGAVYGLSSVVPRQMSKPLASSLLGLSEGQDVFGVGVGYVIGRAYRVKAAAVLRAVVAGNPSPALGAPAIPHRQPFRDRAPVGLTPLFEAQARRTGIKLCILKRPCHLHLRSR
jgi:hypothetical protein